MSRRLRLAGIGGAALLSVYVLAAIVVPRFVNADRFRPMIESRMSAILGRDVSLGTLHVSLWTGIEIRADDLRIAGRPNERESEASTLTAKQLGVRPALLPLLRREVRVRRVRMDEGIVTMGGRTILRDLALRATLRPAGTTAGRVIGSIEGTLVARGTPRVRASFDTVLEGDRLRVVSLSASSGPAEVRAKGEVTGIRGEELRVNLEGSGSLGATEGSGIVAVELRRGQPVVSFKLASPLVDFDELTRLATGAPAHVASTGFFPAARAAAPEPSSTNEGFLGQISGGGRIEAERGRMAGIQMTRLSSQVRLFPGELRFEDASCEVYGGTNRATVVVDLLHDGLPFHLVGAANGVALKPLVNDAAPSYKDALNGTASMALDLSGEASSERISHTLRGKARIEVREGKLATFGILREVAQVLEMAGGRGIGKSETTFDRLSASFVLEAGAAQTKDLEFRSADLDLDGGGSIGLDGPVKLEVVTSFSKDATVDLVNRTPQLKFRVGPEGRLTVPLRIRGTLKSPLVQLDLDRVLQEGLTQTIKDKAKKGLLRRLLEKD